MFSQNFSFFLQRRGVNIKFYNSLYFMIFRFKGCKGKRSTIFSFYAFFYCFLQRRLVFISTKLQNMHVPFYVNLKLKLLSRSSQIIRDPSLKGPGGQTLRRFISSELQKCDKNVRQEEYLVMKRNNYFKTIFIYLDLEPMI